MFLRFAVANDPSSHKRVEKQAANATQSTVFEYKIKRILTSNLVFRLLIILFKLHYSAIQNYLMLNYGKLNNFEHIILDGLQ